MEIFAVVIVIVGMSFVYSLLKQLIAKMPEPAARAAAKAGRSKTTATPPPPPPPPETSVADLHHRAEDLMKRIDVLEEIIASEKTPVGS